jgi:hypothetical protein
LVNKKEFNVSFYDSANNIYYNQIVRLASTLLDSLGKGFTDYIRDKVVDVPIEVLKLGEGVASGGALRTNFYFETFHGGVSRWIVCFLIFI